MKSCNTCKHKEKISVRCLPCRNCSDYCLWDMPTEYKEILIEELEDIKADVINIADGRQSIKVRSVLNIVGRRIKENKQ